MKRTNSRKLGAQPTSSHLTIVPRNTRDNASEFIAGKMMRWEEEATVLQFHTRVSH